ncbi:MAG: hypothetical protein AABM66_01740 [Actinomycetota bacterium]
MRRVVGAFLERNSRGFRRRVPGLVRIAYQPGPEPVPIDHLVSPLRYDIIVRERYFAFLRERRALAEEDVEDFMELSRRQPYFAWFSRIVVPSSNHPEIAADPERLNAAFERRVRASIELLDAFESMGYDRRRPIVLRTGRQIAPTLTGKRLARRMYAADGCHRLALLRLKGVNVLESGMYRVRDAKVLTPRDNTAILLDAMPISPHDYFSFLSLSYADREISSEEALLDHVRSTDPDSLPELEQVIAVDSPRLSTPARPRA